MLNLALAIIQEHEASGGAGLLALRFNLMFWTLIIFGILYWLLSRYAFPVILSSVEAREKALEEAIDAAKRDREEAARVLSEHKAQLEGARAEAQKIIVDARQIAEKSRADLLAQTRADQQEMIERARLDIEMERDRAIAALRHEAVDLAIAGASKVVEENLDTDKNRKLVDAFLSSLSSGSTPAVARKR